MSIFYIDETAYQKRAVNFFFSSCSFCFVYAQKTHISFPTSLLQLIMIVFSCILLSQKDALKHAK